MQASKDFDVIVIGAGHNGLTCASYLAKAGMTVLVLEQYKSVGGMTLTEEITLPGFKSDIHSYSHTFDLLSPAIEDLELKKYGLDFVFPDPTFSNVFPDGKTVSVWRNLEKTCESIAKFSKKDAESWRRLHEMYLGGKQNTIKLLFGPPPPYGILATELEKSAAGMEIFRSLLISVRTWANEWFESDEVKTLFGSWAMHAGFSLEDSNGADFVFLITSICQDSGNGLVRGGSGGIAQALTKYLMVHGGNVLTNAFVDRVIVTNDVATGVQLKDGRSFNARKAVVSAVDPRQTFLRFIGEDKLDPLLAHKVKRMDFGSAVGTMHYALDSQPKYIGGDEVDNAAYVHLTPNFDSMAKVCYECRAGLIPENPWYLATNDSVFDKSRAPQGKYVIKFLLCNLPYRIKGDARKEISEGDWDLVKEKVADRVEDNASHYIRNLRQIKLKRVVESPVDLERRNPNTVEGSLLNGAAQIEQFFGFRPFPGYSQYKTNIEKLYMCGSCTHPGPGVSTAPGYNASRIILQDLDVNFNNLTSLR
ncbi:MAG: NAD(P)/FAD-dependent oxidoreductase [Thaumarchaeota archaeon]|nr:NAD(P)/FAD-dependent oxidoreductase [Nitrososphaerota archaeon]